MIHEFHLFELQIDNFSENDLRSYGRYLSSSERKA